MECMILYAGNGIGQGKRFQLFKAKEGILGDGGHGIGHVGIGAACQQGVSASLYHGVTTFACALSTFLEGVLGAVIYQAFRRKNIDFEWYYLVVITAAAECMHMINLLIFVRPVSIAVSIVDIIALPMIIFNSIGMVLFFSVFKDIYTRQNLIAADKMRLALNIADACIHNIRKNHITQADYKQMERTISGFSRCRDVFFLPYDRRKELFDTEYEFTESFVSKMEEECSTRLVYGREKSAFGLKQEYVASGSKVTMGSETWGYLVLVFERRYSSPEAAECLVSALAKFFSTNYEAYQVEYQKKMRGKCEVLYNHVATNHRQFVKDTIALAGKVTCDMPVYLVGGPMMGSFKSELSPITKTTNAII